MHIKTSSQEHELLDLLSQYEDEDKSGTGGYLTLPSSSSSTSYQPLSIESHSPMDAVYRAMATRMAEEEQTQRIMIVLNEMKPTYPGKTSKELKMVLEEVGARWGEGSRSSGRRGCIVLLHVHLFWRT